MDKWIGGIVAFAVVALIAWLMYRSWRRRAMRDESLTSYPLPESLGAPALAAEALYVATTPADNPLERLAVHGLAFRGAALVEVVAGGLILRVAGESTTYIPAEKLVGASTASYAIDRGVEPDGLVAVTWTPRAADDAVPASPVDSYLRARFTGDAARIIRAVNDIAAAPAAPRPEHESEAADG